MWLGLWLVAIAPLALACNYDGKTYKHEETGRTGWFTFQCVIAEDKGWEIKITGCIWKRTGDSIKIGETKTVDGNTGKCYQDGPVTRFEETLKGDDKKITEDKKPEDKETEHKKSSEKSHSSTSSESEEKTKGEPMKPSEGDKDKAKEELKCDYNGKKYTMEEHFREGHFKFMCAAKDNGWMVEVVACFIKHKDTEVELKVGDEKKLKEATARCYKEGDITLFELKPLEEAKADVKTDLSSDGKTDTKKTQPTEPKPKPDQKPMEKKTMTKPTMTVVEGAVKKDKEGTTKTDKPSPMQPAHKSTKTMEIATAARNVGKAVAKAAKETEVMCKHNEKKYKDGQEWTEGYFKYKCSTKKFTWKVDVTACFSEKLNKEVAVGETVQQDGWTLTCKRQEDGKIAYEEKMDEKS